MAIAHDWKTTAVNQAEESENKIHDDDVARRFGFRGGLVPGVTVYAYAVHPGLTAWGEPWLERGRAEIALVAPVYADDVVSVEVENGTERRYEAELKGSDSTVSARGVVELPTRPIEAPSRRGDPLVAADATRVPAIPDEMARLRAGGLSALPIRWAAKGPLARYTESVAELPAFMRPDIGGLANPAFMLGIANWVLAANVSLGPWIHVASDAQNFASVERDTDLIAEATITDIFMRGGHDFVDLDVAIFASDEPVMRAQHRAIYRLRDSADR